MGPQLTVTNVLFDAFLRCKMKAHLLADGAEGIDVDISMWRRGLARAFEQSALQRLRSQASDGQVCEGMPPLHVLQLVRDSLIINPAIAVPGLCAEVHALERMTVGRLGPQCAFVPVRFVPNAKLTRLDKLAVAFDAVALSRLTGCSPPLAKIIHGPDYTTMAVRLSKLMDEARLLIAELRAQTASAAPPPVILNKHCPECEFQSRCRQIATEQDDLSLIRTITEKERARQNAKGIFTVTQLSCTYRPRRRPSRSSVLSLKHEPALKALAIRKQRVHVVGTPRFTIPENTVHLDVEGIPDREFYYLVGVRYRRDDLDVYEAFWADDPQDERKMWAACLRALSLRRDPVLVHFGSYETQFLKHMKARYHEDSGEADFVSRLITSSVNILSPLYSQVYFPTYSNSLKAIARHLGFGWSDPDASGLRALMWRSEWETSRHPSLKQKLITYNAEDCEAAQCVTEAITAICSEQQSESRTQSISVNVDFLDREHSRRFGRLAYALPDFKTINEAAYWDYQRSRIYIRSEKHLRRASPRKLAYNKKHVNFVNLPIPTPRPEHCMRCGSKTIYKHRLRSKIIFDLRVSRTGIRRVMAKQSYMSYRCPQCGCCTSQSLPSRFGRNLSSYIVYHIIELRLSLHAVAQHLNVLFRIQISKDAISRIKSKCGEQYRKVYDTIIHRITNGALVHCDETKIIVDGQPGYVWVFANVGSVAYIYSATRDACTPKGALQDFRGVLVSDFYGAYEAIDCAQQKCLVHLMRDINDDVLRHPFNGEMEEVARSFAGLIRPMIETVDRFGLKAYHLRKHKKAVGKFFRMLARRNYRTEVAVGYKRRFERNAGKLFTLLDYDGVPWNNNNAEHAVKSIARLRNVIGANCTSKGILDYLVLLSISESCKYKGVNFFDFLCSGDMDLDVFAARSAACRRGL